MPAAPPADSARTPASTASVTASPSGPGAAGGGAAGALQRPPDRPRLARREDEGWGEGVGLVRDVLRVVHRRVPRVPATLAGDLLLRGDDLPADEGGGDALRLPPPPRRH